MFTYWVYWQKNVLYTLWLLFSSNVCVKLHSTPWHYRAYVNFALFHDTTVHAWGSLYFMTLQYMSEVSALLHATTPNVAWETKTTSQNWCHGNVHLFKDKLTSSPHWSFWKHITWHLICKCTQILQRVLGTYSHRATQGTRYVLTSLPLTLWGTFSPRTHSGYGVRSHVVLTQGMRYVLTSLPLTVWGTYSPLTHSGYGVHTHLLLIQDMGYVLTSNYISVISNKFYSMDDCTYYYYYYY